MIKWKSYSSLQLKSCQIGKVCFIKSPYNVRVYFRIFGKVRKIVLVNKINKHPLPGK